MSDFKIAMSIPKWSAEDKLRHDEIERIFKHSDLDEDGFLCYREILYACVAAKLVAKEERLRMAFDKLDINDDGTISAQEMQAILDINDVDAAAIINEVDLNKDGRIDYDEFLEMWRINSKRIPSTI